MTVQIFYGAGKNAYENFEQWLKDGYSPVCIIDRDANKQNTFFCVGEKSLEILSLEEALKRYPECEIYITLMRQNLKEVTEYLLEQGIAKNRIKYFEAVEYRLGCPYLGKMYLTDNTIRSCCVPGYFSVSTALGDSIEESYKRYMEFTGDILHHFKENDAYRCQGCRHLKMDIYEITPQVDSINISSKDNADYCNAKCIYCCHYPKPGKEALLDRKKEVIDTFLFFEKNFPETKFNVGISGGDISVAPYKEELFEILFRNNWHTNFMTNAAIYCEEISQLMKEGKAEMLVTLDTTVPELYHKCKGINALPKVMENLRQYAKNGRVILKWIVLDGIYHDFSEIKGIVDFAKEIGALLCLSCNTYTVEERLSEEAFLLTRRFIQYTQEKQVFLTVYWDHFHKEDSKRLREELGI